jgi:hypothetical protein
MHTVHRFMRIRALLALLVPLYLLAIVGFPGTAAARPSGVICPLGASALPKSPTSSDVTTYVTTNGLVHNANAAATISSSSVVVTSTTLGTLESDDFLNITDKVCPSSTPVLYAAFTATGGKSFVFLGPPGKTASYPAGFEVFRVDSGNLIIAGGTSTLRKP